MEKDTDGSPVITYKNVIYDVDYIEDKKSFTIWWRMSVLWAFFTGKLVPIYMYRRIVVAMGIIGYNVQMACSLENSEKISENADGETNDKDSLRGGNQSKIYCPNCGGEIKADSKFCFYCGRKLEEATNKATICPICGKPCKETDKFCENCVAKLK